MPENTPIHAAAWLVDDDGDLWVLAGPDPVGTGMAVYVPGDVAGYGIPVRALAIEDTHGIRTRGPLVALVDTEPAAEPAPPEVNSDDVEAAEAAALVPAVYAEPPTVGTAVRLAGAGDRPHPLYSGTNSRVARRHETAYGGMLGEYAGPHPRGEGVHLVHLQVGTAKLYAYVALDEFGPMHSTWPTD